MFITLKPHKYHYENKYLPKGWTICSLDDLATFGGGKTPSMDNRKYWNNAKHLWITSKDMKFAHIADSLLKISDAALDQMTIYGKGTLLIVTRSGILRHTFPIAILDTEATVNQDVKAISCVLSHIHTYLYYVIKAQEQVILKDYHKDGTTVDSIDFDKFKKLIVPLPPLSEQYRIVEEIEHWFALIDQIEQGKTDLQTTIKQIKGKILDLAIHGKLVPQDPNDESAIELLKRINPDFTPCDNGHYTFDVPSGWITTNLGSIFNVVSAKRILKSDWKHSGVPFYRAREIAKLSIYGLVDNELYISEEHYNSLKEKFPVPKASDIMISAIGTIGKCYIVKESDKFYYKDASVLCLCNDYQINTKYIYHIMRSEYMLKQMYDNSKGTTVDTITIEKAKQYILPLPPLAEQQRIVAKIEETFSIFDGIQNSLEA